MPNYDRNPPLTRDIRHDICKDVWKFAQIMARRCVVTFDESAITITLFPPSGESYRVPGGPHTHVVRDNVVED